MIINKEKYDVIKNYINIANNIAIFCHINPDGDTLGSGLALYSFLKKAGKKVAVFCEDNPPAKLSFLPDSDKINNEMSDAKFDLAIAVDISDEERLGIRQVKKFFKAKNNICIDHHKTNTGFAKYTLFEPASATCEIIYKLMRYIDKTLIDRDAATCVACGIITDSGAFNYSSTTAETHEIVAELYGFDFDISEIIYRLIREVKLNVFKLKNRVFAKTIFECDNQIAIITFTKEDFAATDTSKENTDGIVSELIAIDTVKFAVAMTEERKASYKVSFRTKAPYDSSECAGVFGGGGHKFAGGCRIDGFYYDVIDKLVKVCKDRL